MAAVTKKIKKEEELEDQEIDQEEEEEEEEEQPKKKPAAKEDTPAWAKTIIKLLTPEEAPPAAKIIPAPKAPAPKEKEDAADQEKTEDQTDQPKQTFLGWFW